MKQDWDLFRVLLAAIEAETLHEFLRDPKKIEKWKAGQLLSESRTEQDPAIRVVLVHLKMLADEGMIEGVTISESLDGYFSYGLGANVLLTSKGYKMLGTLRSDGVWQRIRKYATKHGIALTVEAIQMIAPVILGKMLEGK